MAVSSDNTYVEGNSVSLVSTDGGTAWATYSVAGLTTNRPVKLGLDVEATTTLPGGGGDHLSIEYWVGVANYSAYNWEWRGPFFSAKEITLHNEEIRSRYVSREYGLHFAVVCRATNVGSSGVKLNASTITTRDVEDELYLHTIPHAPLPTGFTHDSGTRETVLNWEHFEDVHDPESTAHSYGVFRKLNVTETEELLAVVPASGTTFTEPDDIFYEVTWPVDGLEASYFVAGDSSSGVTPKMHNATVQHGLGQPLGFFATQGSNPDGVELSWNPYPVADGFLIYRGGMLEENIIAEIPPGEEYFDSTASKYDEHTYYLRATVNDDTSEISEAATGFWNGVMVTTWGIDDGLYLTSACNDRDNNTYLIGSAGPYESGRGMTTKFSPTGQFEWAKRISPLHFSSKPLYLTTDSVNDVYISGTASSGNIFFMKLLSDGTHLWTKNWGGDNDDYGGPIISGLDNAIYTSSSSWSWSGDSPIILFHELNQNGGILQELSIPGDSTADFIFDIALDLEGNTFVCGTTYSPAQAFFIKLDGSGTVLVNQFFRSGNFDDVSFEAISSDSTGAIYLAGSTETSSGAKNGIIHKYDIDGNEEWKLTLANDDIILHDLVLSDAEKIFVVGRQGPSLLLLKLDLEGNIETQKTWTQFNGTNALAKCSFFDSNGNLVIAGGSTSAHGTWESSNLNLISVEKTNGSPNYSSYGISGEQSESEIITESTIGTIDSQDSSYDFLLMVIPASEI